MRFIVWWLRVAVVAVVAAIVAALVALVVAGSQGDARTQVAALAAASLIISFLVVRRIRRRRIRDWRDAEDATARWLRKAGCRRVSLTRAGADGGIDVITSEWAVQVKHTSKPVGRPAVQQLVGAAITLDRFPVLFSTSGFSQPARRYADEHDVALFELDLDGRAHGLNRSARRVGKRSRRLRLAIR